MARKSEPSRASQTPSKGRRAPAVRPPSRRPATPKPLPVTLLLVDDHPLFRQSLRAVLERPGSGVRVLGEASDGEEAVALAEAKRPDVVLMDLDLPGTDGIQATKRIVATSSETRVLIISASDERSRVIAAVRAGALGYVLKTASADDISNAVRRVHAGELAYPPKFSQLVIEATRGAEETVRLLLVGRALIRRQGLARLLEESDFSIEGQAETLEDALPMIAANPPSVVIVDLGSGDGTGFEQVHAANPGVGVVVLADDSTAIAALDALTRTTGGIGVLLIERLADVDELATALRRVAGGASIVDPEIVNRLVRQPRAGNGLGGLGGLSEREREVLSLMAEGWSNQAISEQLFLSGKTVEGHVGNIFLKLGLEPAMGNHRRVLAVLAFLRNR